MQEAANRGVNMLFSRMVLKFFFLKKDNCLEHAKVNKCIVLLHL